MKTECPMNVVVTGGGTIAPIDDVRLLTNVSSGRFAAAITEACLDRGATVWHIHAVSAQLPSEAFRRVCPRRRRPRRGALAAGKAPRKVAEPARSLAACSPQDRQRRRLCRDLEARSSNLSRSTSSSCRWRSPISSRSRGRVKSAPTAESLVLHCRRTPKVIRLVRDWSPSVYLVGFKLLSQCQPRGAHRCEPRPPAGTIGPTSPSPTTSRPCGRDGTRSIWSARAMIPKRSIPATTWPSGWSRASWAGRRSRRRSLRSIRPTVDHE